MYEVIICEQRTGMTMMAVANAVDAMFDAINFKEDYGNSTGLGQNKDISPRSARKGLWRSKNYYTEWSCSQNIKDRGLSHK